MVFKDSSLPKGVSVKGKRTTITRMIQAFVALSLVFFMTASASAQVTAGGVRGVVTDAAGAVVPGVAIQITNLETDFTATAESSGAGNYVMVNIPVGPYRLEATLDGFKTYVAEDLQVLTATTSTLNITMEVGELVQQITVSETIAPITVVETSEVSTNVEERVVMDLPLQVQNGRRQAENFIFLTPGVAGDTFSKSYNGSPDLAQVAMVDGIAFSNAEVPGRFTTFAPPFESVEEFKVSSTLYPAELGRGFGVTNYKIKSGTNEFHGNAFEFLRNEKLDASGFFAGSRAPTRQNEFGATIGGPIIKNRTFFFFNYTGFRRRGSRPTSLLTLPPTAFRSGDFSRLIPELNIMVFDPATTRDDGMGGFVRDAFPNNMIPASRHDSLAGQVTSLMPTPDTSALFNNFLTRSESPTNEDHFVYRIDEQINDSNKFSWTHWRNLNPVATAIGSFGRDAPLDNGFPGGGYFQGMRANWDSVINPTLLNHFAFGFSGTFGFGRGFDTRNGAEILSIPGLPSSYAGTTSFRIGHYTGFGNAGAQGDARWDHTYNYSNTTTIIRGKHQIKVGGEHWAQSFRDFNVLNGGGTAGTMTFNRLFTSQPNADDFARQGEPYASFLLGQVNSLRRLVGGEERTLRIPYLGFFFTDTIQMGPRWTLSLGVRYDIAFPWRGKDPDRASAIDLNMSNPGAGGLPGAHVFGNDAIVPAADKGAFGPRGSIAYQLDDKTVVRLGYGIIYSISNASTTGSVQFNNNFDNGFLGFQNLVSTDNGITPAGMLKDGFPSFTTPPRGPELGIGSTVDFYNGSAGLQAYQQTWTLNIQRQLPYLIHLDLAYVGNKGQRLSAGLENLNQVPSSYLSLGPLLNQRFDSPDAIAAGITAPWDGFGAALGGAATVNQALRPFPQFTGINNPWQPIGASSYHSFQMKLQKRFSDGLSFLTSYTLSKNLTNTSLAAFAAFNGGARDTANRGIEKAIAPKDQTHNLVSSFVYELPFGKNVSGPAAGFLKGWQVSAIVRYASGQPLGISGGPPIPLFGGGNRPHRVAGVSGRSNVSAGSFDPGRGDRYLNADGWVQPAPFTFGTGAPREPNLRNFAFFNEDFSIIKRTYIGETMNVEFRTELFNLFNRVRFGNPNTSSTSGAFGLVGGQGNPPRQIQFGLKFNF